MAKLKPLRWVASSKDDLSAMPPDVGRHVGYALYAAQQGEKHHDPKALKGFGNAGVIEIVSRRDGDAFRSVYTVHFAQAIYVIHVFQKKAKRGVATPKQDIDLIRARLKIAAADYQNWSGMTMGGRT